MLRLFIFLKMSPFTETWRSNSSESCQNICLCIRFVLHFPPLSSSSLIHLCFIELLIGFPYILIMMYFSFAFSHTGLQVLGHYIRRQQDPETFISEIKYIASDPDDKYFFNVTDEAALNDIVDALGDRIFTLEGSWLNKKQEMKEFCCSLTIITMISVAENHFLNDSSRWWSFVTWLNFYSQSKAWILRNYQGFSLGLALVVVLVPTLGMFIFFAWQWKLHIFNFSSLIWTHSLFILITCS